MPNFSLRKPHSLDVTSSDAEEAAQMPSTHKRATVRPQLSSDSSASTSSHQSQQAGQSSRIISRAVAVVRQAIASISVSEWMFIGLILLCYTYFSMPFYYATNVISRWDMVYAFVHGQATIDIHAKNTIDVSYYNGHWYSPRSLGLSLAATPALWALSLFYRLDFPPQVAYSQQTYVMTLFTVIPVGIATAIVFRRFIVRLRPQLADSPLPFVAAGAFALATLVYPFSIVFYSHAFGGGLLFIAFFLLYRARSQDDSTWSLVLAGILTGLGVISEYMAGLIFLVLCGYILLAFPDRRIKSLALYGAGMAPWGVVLAWYNWFAFGNPLKLSYGYVAGSEFQGQHSGFFGVNTPQLSGLWQILGYPRGLLIESPFLILIPIGLYLWYRSGTARLEALVVIAVSVIYPLAVSSYFLPMAGPNEPGPRLLVPMLPFACLGLAWLVDDARLWLRGLLTVTVGFSLLITFLYVIVGARIYHTYGAYPFSDLYIPTLLTGNVPVLNGPTPSNWGYKFLHLPMALGNAVIALALAMWFVVSARALLLQRRTSR